LLIADGEPTIQVMRLLDRLRPAKETPEQRKERLVRQGAAQVIAQLTVEQDAGKCPPHNLELGKCPKGFEAENFIRAIGERANTMLVYVAVSEPVIFDKRASVEASAHGVREGFALRREIDPSALKIVFKPQPPGTTMADLNPDLDVEYWAF